MAQQKAVALKPFHLEEKKGPNGIVSEATVAKWKQVCMQNLKKEDRFQPYYARAWDVKQADKGLRAEGDNDDRARAKVTIVDDMLTYIAQYAPEVLFRDITRRCNSLEEVWTCIKEWANIKVTGSKHQQYHHLRDSYIHGSDEMTPNNFFHVLRNAKEDCLLLANTNVQRKKLDN